jgi:hypothetical protein
VRSLNSNLNSTKKKKKSSHRTDILIVVFGKHVLKYSHFNNSKRKHCPSFFSPVHAFPKPPGILCVHTCVWTGNRKDLKIPFWVSAVGHQLWDKCLQDFGSRILALGLGKSKAVKSRTEEGPLGPRTSPEIDKTNKSHHQAHCSVWGTPL